MSERTIEREGDTAGDDSVYTGDEIPTAVEDEDDTGRTDARLAGMESTADGFRLHVEEPSGEVTAVELAADENGRLSDELRRVFHYVGAGTQDPTAIAQERIPVRKTEQGVELDLPAELPPSNGAAAERSEERSMHSLRFWQGLLAMISIGVLGVVGLLVTLVSSLGVSTASIAPAIAAQLLAGIVLFVYAIK